MALQLEGIVIIDWSLIDENLISIMIDEEVDAPLVVEETPKEEGRERKMTSKGEGFQRDFLTKECKRRMKNLTQTIGLFEDLLRSKGRRRH